MATFFLAPALGDNGLRGEVNKRYPNRDKSSDGWIGDASHAARPSDHNPCWSCSGRAEGIVRAIDIDISPDGRADRDIRADVLKATIGDPRVWYVISNGKIYSRTFDWAARTYTGSNPHFAHVHVSLNGANGVNPEGNFDTSRWFDRENRPLPRKTIDLSILQNQMARALGLEKGKIEYKHTVRFTQLALNKRLDASLVVDGIMGDATLNAWGRFERQIDRKGKDRPRLADEESLRALVKGTRLDWKP